MQRKIIFITLLGLAVFGFFNTTYADTTVHLDIETAGGEIYNQDITVTPCDSEDNGVMTITAYCALVQSGIASDWSGLWINSINGIINNDGENGIYWMWLANLNTNNATPESSYNLSAKQYILNQDDKILFYYGTNPLNISVSNLNPTVGDNVIITVTELGLDSSWNPIWNQAVGGKITVGSDTFDLDDTGSYSLTVSDTNTFTIKGQKTGFIDTSEITITPQAIIVPPPVISGGGGGGSGSYFTPPPVEKVKFDLEKAFQFILSQQKENGSFGEDLYTDWIALTLASGNHQEQTIKLIKFFGETKIDSLVLTDYERHVMALMALGLNPYNTNGINYIEKIIASFDGKQFGDANEINDDIFALIVLQNAGYFQDEKIINDDISFVLSKQKENGSWDESIDMTGASMEALFTFNQNESVKNALEKAKEFLKQNQKDDGGWNNASSTAWAIEGILAMGEKPEDWKKNEDTPLDYLATIQDTDGGIKNEYLQNKIWETAYVVSSLSNKTWNQVMQKFTKPKEIIIPQKIEEKSPQQTITKKSIPIAKSKNKASPVGLQPREKEISKIENLANQNVATAINAFTDSTTETKTEIPKRNWFLKLLDKVFNIF
ncbi:MAG: prenyltransferase/squalene oxidase repeat-containing protein [Candidatus Paceibacterota bacterium]